MASKYEGYWLSRRSELNDAIERAAAGTKSILDVADLGKLGQRKSWYGSATVQGSTIVNSANAHAASLARVVAEQNMCSRWPEKNFRFTISHGLTLAVATGPSLPGAAPTATRTSHWRASTPRAECESRPMPMDLAMTCERVHALIERLPVWSTPSDVSFDNGLYFFYESGERSQHAPAGRVVRVGNHPHAQDRLRGRLKDHFRSGSGAKNGSVFRRYIGGALIRRENSDSSCLAPGPGEGHWERQRQPACVACAPVETQVTDRLNSAFWFRCVRIDDRSERNTFEARLIATLAMCPVCGPTETWLGRHAYPSAVRESGLWNTDFIGGPTLTQDDLGRLEHLVHHTVASTRRAGRDLQNVLLVIPCSGGKKPLDDELQLPSVQVADLLSPEANALLSEGRRQAFDRPDTRLHRDSPFKPALTYYTGQPYATTGVKEMLVELIHRGLHCLIISGGYGVVRPEELIHKYDAYIQQTRVVWSGRLPSILRDYVGRNQINESIVLLSKPYAPCVPVLTESEQRFVPSFRQGFDDGSARRVVPAMIGSQLASTLATLLS